MIKGIRRNGKSAEPQPVQSGLPPALLDALRGTTAFTISPQGTVLAYPIKGKKATLAELQYAVGGYIQQVIIPSPWGGWKMFVDEEGLLKPNPVVNPLATQLAYGDHPNLTELLFGGTQTLVGTAVLVRHV
jgi:hypothetical protein